MGSDDYHTEYLDYKISLKIVKGLDEAVKHINRFGSHYTDSIVTSNRDTAALFLRLVDSANVYHNCSTRFADGFRYGFGAEVGIYLGFFCVRENCTYNAVKCLCVNIVFYPFGIDNSGFALSVIVHYITHFCIIFRFGYSSSLYSSRASCIRFEKLS